MYDVSWDLACLLVFSGGSPRWGRLVFVKPPSSLVLACLLLLYQQEEAEL